MFPIISRLRLRRGVRWNCVLATLSSDIKSGKCVKGSDVQKVLESREMTASDIEHLHEILKLNTKNDVANEVLCYGLPHDFSLYFTASRNDPHFVLSNKALEPLIRHNPGRVFSLTDLLARHGGESVSDAIRIVVVNKLLRGEKAETEEKEFLPSDANVLKAISLLNQVPSMSVAEESLIHLIDVLREKKAVPALALLRLDGFYVWLASSQLVTEKDPDVFLALSQLIFNHNRSLLNKEMLGRAMSLGFTDNKNSLLTLLNFGLCKQPLENRDFADAVLKYVEENKLDFDKLDPESLLLRMQLMETYGIFKDDVDSVLRKFHEYQTHEKFGIDLVQAKVVKAFCYQSFKANNETFLKIAETLIRPEGLAVHTVAQLILAKSRFSSEKSLETYNNYINLVSKDVNETTGRSPTGILTEAMMVGSLYDNDREFAQLLFEKAIVNRIISNEQENALIKKVFKAYGDSFVEDDWKIAQPLFAEYVLENIKKL